MTDITTKIESATNMASQSAPVSVKTTTVFVGGNSVPTSGITQSQADARYVRLPATGVPDGYVVASNGSGGANWRLPSVPYASTDW